MGEWVDAETAYQHLGLEFLSARMMEAFSKLQSIGMNSDPILTEYFQIESNNVLMMGIAARNNLLERLGEDFPLNADELGKIPQPYLEAMFWLGFMTCMRVGIHIEEHGGESIEG